jgi:hypothetical protein
VFGSNFCFRRLKTTKSTESMAKPKLNGVDAQRKKLNSGTWGHEVLNMRADRERTSDLFQGRHKPIEGNDLVLTVKPARTDWTDRRSRRRKPKKP